MGFGLSVYLIFALTTAIMSCLVLLRPALDKIAEAQPLNNLAQQPGVAYITFFLMSLLAAPLILFPIFSNNANKKFQSSFIKAVLE